MRHLVTKIAQTILFAGIALFTFCTSTFADMDWKRMKRDLSIQESILDQFFDEKKVSTTGLYIEKHGVLLIASGGIHKYEVRVRVIDKSESITTPVKGVIQRQMSRGDKSSENEEEEILEFSMTEKKEQNEATKKQIAEFLSIYGNTIGQLKDDDRVTIRVHSAERDFHSFRFPSIEFIHSDSISIRMKKHTMEGFKKIQDVAEKQWEEIEKIQEASKKQLETIKKRREALNKKRMEALQKEREASKNIAFKIAHPKGILLEASVTKRDIEAYNRGKIDEQAFHNRITFREHKPEPARDKTIDIMADILTNILKKDTDLHFLSGTQCTGFYQKGIGALFLVSRKSSLLHSEPKNIDTLKAAVISTLADYGPTLRGLSPEESIIVHANLIGQSHYKIGDKDKTTDIKPPDRILFRVTKRDIEAYASQKIDLDTFKKRVAITEM